MNSGNIAGIIMVSMRVLTLLPSEWPKLHRVLVILSPIGLIYKKFDLICLDLICCY